jgi:hypothetical protein
MRLTEDERFAKKYGVRRIDVSNYELRNGVDNVVGKYEFQRTRARLRGIEWLFDLKGWMEVWDGKIAKRGRGLRALCMCRHKDEGPYAPWNVRIATGYENRLDWWEKKPHWYRKDYAGQKYALQKPVANSGHHMGPKDLAMLEMVTDFGRSAKRLHKAGLLDEIPD